MTKRISKQDSDDQLYWQRVAKIVGAQLVGWTFRSYGSVRFRATDCPIEVNGQIAERLVELDDVNKELYEALDELLDKYKSYTGLQRSPLVIQAESALAKARGEA